jgi:cobyric acid synthase CobQ
MLRGNDVSSKKKPAIMFQGTTSNAGKSVMAAAFCRILLNDGFRVAPFKAQNMSLNSYVTRSGGEMGRAQVVQAQACRIEPDVRMNPVLLKPTCDTGSQIIVLGKPLENMNVIGYTNYKKQLYETIHDAYDSLSSEYDVIVLEGAGSPAEVNLKAHDLVNMHMALYAEAPVLLVGDIDRGGVYAHFLGTFMCLDDREKELLKGYVVNRFRGDATLLGPAHDFMLERTGKPVIGVVPFIKKLGIPEEDSVTFKNGDMSGKSLRADSIEIVCIDLPHISNFTDIDAFRIEPDVTIRVARSANEIGSPDVILIPGSKNVPGDLASLKNSGMAERIKRLAAEQRHIVGICGGFQMLGKTVSDPYGLESGSSQTFTGLKLLDVNTVLEKDKQLILTTGKHLDSGFPVRGYEIHHGRTVHGSGMVPIFTSTKDEVAGVATGNRRIWGTYLHGIFDNDEFRRWFIDNVRQAKGLPALTAVQARYDIDPYIEQLATVVRESIDMKKVYEWMGI